MKRSLGLVILAVTIPAFASDMTIVSKVTRNDAPPETAMSYISDDHIRMSHGDEREMIIDLKSGQMTTLDNRKKTYFVTTRADMEAMAARMREMMNNPEMKRAQEAAKHMNGSRPAFGVDVHKEGTSRKVAGYNCDNWIVAMGQYSTSEECVTSELKLPDQIWDTYKDFQNMMRSAMGPMARSGGSDIMEQFKKMKGFPLSTTTTTNIMGHKTVTTNEVTEVRRGPIPASAWQVPAGYTKVDNPMQAMGRSRR